MPLRILFLSPFPPSPPSCGAQPQGLMAALAKDIGVSRVAEVTDRANVGRQRWR